MDTVEGRRGYGIATIGDNFFIIGGQQGNQPTGKNEMYNSITKVWGLKSSLKLARRYVLLKISCR